MESLNPHGPSSGPHYDCLVISDLHLGSDVCQAKLLEEFLIWAVGHCDQLVINGDIFDDLNFKRLTKRHFACLKVIRRNTDRPDFRLVWVRGNHDGPIDIISHVVGVDIQDEYVYDNHRIRLLILHGDQFDTFITANPLLTEHRLRVVLFHPEMDAAPGGAIHPANHRSSGKETASSSSTEPSNMPGPWLSLRDLRAYPFSAGCPARRRALLEQRHLDRVPSLSVRGGPG